MHDEYNYSNPDDFIPERFAKQEDPGTKSPLDPSSVVFGFGRR